MSKQFPYLSSPIKIGNIQLRNRVVFSAHLTNFAERNLPGERHAYYYGERAKGGAGLIITEELSVHPSDHAYEKLVDAFSAEALPGYRMITGMVHQYGARIFAQLNHNGNQGTGLYNQLAVWGASPVADPLFCEVPKEIDQVEIDELIRFYAKSALLAQEGGFDGVEFQGSHSSLLRQFLSPYTNRRRDGYGGSAEGRIRLLREVGQAVREAVGPDFCLGIRLSGEEFVDQGLTLNDVVDIARSIEGMDLFNYLNTSVGIATHALYLVEGPMCLPPAYAVYMSSAIKQAVKLPVITVGRIKDPHQGEQVLRQGHADLVGMVRAQISDAYFARKSFNGQEELIRGCLSCNQDCIGRVGLNQTIGCVQNPAVGKEKIWGQGMVKPAPRTKQVYVIGGGPAGMQAALAAAQRGHRVSLFEKDHELGGQVRFASRLPYRSEFGDHIRNLLNELKTVPVQVYLGHEIRSEEVAEKSPDAVIVATGSLPQALPVPGCDQKNVLTVLQLLTQDVPLGEKVLIVDQLGFYQATGVAEMLADQGKKVEILSSSLYVGQGLGRTLDLDLWYQRARKKQIVLTPNVSFLGVDGDTVKGIHNYSGQQLLWEHIDHVVLAVPHRANDAFYFSLKGKVRELYRIGDCVAPRRLDAAVSEGFKTGSAL
ncbi:mycofactocin system FadH/OYE family oxidoreductase 2 [Candidatus Formimonas warabiya]|uniref:NADH:flavin oxidoreductase n=1 Tax=Formimonas warabiya TaxID=1761012 RepID=A0A3G1KR43_FORW1|nr:mycofactocin system FadH/OYE family oxidoreductase 2 [Candidatus Formimonas warabiya]ATW24928.1 NADH:flavin oxidoreductase [Candidatus Formimonas warabiya]